MNKKYSVAFFGTPLFSKEILSHLITLTDFKVSVVVTQEDTPQGRGKVVTAPPVKVVAKEHGIPILQPKRINRSEESFTKEYLSYGPYDIAVVVAFGQIIPKSVLEIPLCGSINIHTSLLPKYRGAAPIQRAIMDGEKETGVCLMKMDEGLDTGGVYANTTVPIGNLDTYDAITLSLLEASKKLLSSDLIKIVTGKALLTPQATIGDSYAKKITNSEAYINFNQDSLVVHNHIRGLSSIPGAFTFVNGKRLKIFLASPVKEQNNSAGKPGEIIFLDPHSLHIACAQGSIAILEAQIEGKKKQGISELLSGVKLERGMILGSDAY